MTQPTKEECWERFWKVVARAHANACIREAAARAAAEGVPESTSSTP